MIDVGVGDGKCILHRKLPSELIPTTPTASVLRLPILIFETRCQGGKSLLRALTAFGSPNRNERTEDGRQWAPMNPRRVPDESGQVGLRRSASAACSVQNAWWTLCCCGFASGWKACPTGAHVERARLGNPAARESVPVARDAFGAFWRATR